MTANSTNSEEIMERLVTSTSVAAYKHIFASLSQTAQQTISEDTHALVMSAAMLLGMEENLSQDFTTRPTSGDIEDEDVKAEARIQSARLARSIMSTWFEHILMAREDDNEDIVLDKNFCLTGVHRPDFYEDLLLAGSRYELGESGTIAILTAGCSNFLSNADHAKLPDELYLCRLGDAYSVLSQERHESFDNYLEKLDPGRKIQELLPLVIKWLTPIIAEPISAGYVTSAEITESAFSNNDRLLSTCARVQVEGSLITSVSVVTDDQMKTRVECAMKQCVGVVDTFASLEEESV